MDDLGFGKNMPRHNPDDAEPPPRREPEPEPRPEPEPQEVAGEAGEVVESEPEFSEPPEATGETAAHEEPASAEEPSAAAPQPTEAIQELSGGRFKSVEDLYNSYLHWEHVAGRHGQQIQQYQQQLAQAQEQLELLTPLENLSDEDYSRLEAQARKYGFSTPEELRAAKSLVSAELSTVKRENENRALQSEVANYLASHPNFKHDYGTVEALAAQNQHLFVTPPGATLDQRVMHFKTAFDGLYAQAEVRRMKAANQKTAQARKLVDESNKQQQAQARRMARGEASSAKGAGARHPAQPTTNSFEEWAGRMRSADSTGIAGALEELYKRS